MSSVCAACGSATLEVDVKCGRCGRPLLETGVFRMVGSVVLDYEIVDVLGQGGMSVVYHARHVVTAQEAALKILPRSLAAHQQVKSRFLEEARALAQLDHPNIVHLYQFGEADGCLVLAMQMVQGATFERMILGRGRVPWKLAISVAIDVARALEYAHDRGIIHRDMKPSNVLVRDDTGAATVMDFGIAKMSSSTRLTATGQTMGTVRYMSPEQVRGQQVNPRTDLYSLGVTLYEALVGDTPFDGETHFELMTKRLNEPPPPPSSRGAELPGDLEAVILRALTKPRDGRFPSATAMREALEAVRDGCAPLLDDAPRLAESAQPLTVAEKTERVALQSKRAPVVWLALASLVVAASVAVFVAVAREPGGSTVESAIATAAEARLVAAPAPPPPFLFAAVIPEVDRTYDDEHLRVLSVRGRDVDAVAAAVSRARGRFVAFLSERLGREVAPEPAFLNVVLVPAALICDRRLYKDDSGYEGCEQRESHYRVRERTLYVADNERLLDVNLPSEIAMQTCLALDASVQAACAEAFTEFERRLPGRR